MKTIAFIVVLISLQSVNAQKYDFFDFKSKAGLNICEVRDSTNSANLVNTLLAMPADSFVLHKNEYHQELGMAYYKLSGYTNDSNYMRKAAIEIKKALEIDPYNTYSLWSMAMFSSMLHECKNANYYLDIYIRLETIKKNLHADSIKSIRKCK